MDHYLKFADAEEAAEKLEAAYDYEVTGSRYDSPRNAEIDRVGIIYRPTGETLTDSEGNEYPEMAPLDGYHVNIRGELPESLSAYNVGAPKKPACRFA